MARDGETHEESLRLPAPQSSGQPGVVFIWTAGRPLAIAHPLGDRGIEVGRGTPAGALDDDDRVSRKHVAVQREEDGFHIRDLRSRNGTFVEGRDGNVQQTRARPEPPPVESPPMDKTEPPETGKIEPSEMTKTEPPETPELTPEQSKERVVLDVAGVRMEVTLKDAQIIGPACSSG